MQTAATTETPARNRNIWRDRLSNLFMQSDGIFCCTVLALLAIGLVMMFSASYPAALDEQGQGAYYLIRQLIFSALGLAAMFVLSYIDYHIFRKTWVSASIFAVAVALLVAVLFIGTEFNGATRWLSLKFNSSAASESQMGGLTFQPSEIMKIAIVLFFSMLISNRSREQMQTWKHGIFPFLLCLGIVAVLMMLEPHLSGTLIICTIGMTLVFIGGAKLKHFGALLLLGIAAIGCIVFLLIEVEGVGYFKNRFISWLDPFNEDYSQSITWQTCQSLIAIGSGGLFGLGLGSSRQKYGYLPEAQNDFVFAIVCEELGFVGAVTVILLFGLLFFRGFYIAAKAKDRFGMLVATGLTMHIGLQALLNIGVVSNTIPNTGISLPFFSYGGTALMMQLAEMGIVLNISRQAKLE